MLSTIVPTVTLKPRQLVRLPPDEIELATDGHNPIVNWQLMVSFQWNES